MRRQLRQHRANIPPHVARRAAARAARQLSRSGCLRGVRHVALYLRHGTELDPAPLLRLLRQHRLNLYVPKIGACHGMRFLQLRRDTVLRRNRYGIAEPVGHRPQRSLRKMDLVILPLLGFDAHGRRLGMGGGYYDRALSFLRSFGKPRLLGYAYAIQEVAAIPAQRWDIHLDGVVTERGVRIFDRSSTWPIG
ncbi:MAG TPA: 5-formyltetrahydrofolate cyclo-ligase [Stenotrophobium sp.]|nr:5-formyltetrahydrofolate cyclo-ligase [Stenotrophobium sp.]